MRGAARSQSWGVMVLCHVTQGVESMDAVNVGLGKCRRVSLDESIVEWVKGVGWRDGRALTLDCEGGALRFWVGASVGGWGSIGGGVDSLLGADIGKVESCVVEGVTVRCVVETSRGDLVGRVSLSLLGASGSAGWYVVRVFGGRSVSDYDAWNGSSSIVSGSLTR